MIFKFYFDTHNILYCYNVSHNVILILFCYLHSYCYIVISYLFVRIVLLYFITINYIHSIIIIIIIISLTHLIFFLPNNSLIHYKKGSKKKTENAGFELFNLVVSRPNFFLRIRSIFYNKKLFVRRKAILSRIA